MGDAGDTGDAGAQKRDAMLECTLSITKRKHVISHPHRRPYFRTRRMKRRNAARTIHSICVVSQQIMQDFMLENSLRM